MLKKNDQIKIIHCSLNMMHFCHDASKIMTPTPGHSETMQQTCQGLSKIFSSLEKDFENIAKMSMSGFTKKEIKTIIIIKSKKDLKKRKQDNTVLS